MKKTAICFGLSALLFSNYIFALEKCATSMGNVTINKVTLGCMTINGSASLTGTKFTGDLMLTGPLKATDVKFKGLNVTGPVTMENTVIDGPAHIIGAMQAISTNFNQKLVINAVDISLLTSSTKDILIESNQPSTLLLTNSTINGNIVFKNAHGTVTNSKSTVNGKIIQPTK